MTSPPCRLLGPRRASSARGSRPRSFTPRSIAAPALALSILAGCGDSGDSNSPGRFDVDRAIALVDQQVAVGQRPAGSPQLRRLADRLRAMLPDGTFEPVPSSGSQRGLRNIVGVIPGRAPAILIGAHYDTEWHPKGFVGANDSAAGTAAVVELARTLPSELPAGHRETRLVLFDGEEEPPGCKNVNFASCALRGSRAYAEAHPGQIGEMILLDYIANRGARIRHEGNSNPELWAEVRRAAEEVGAEGIFPPGEGTAVLDDHIPFVEQGVPAIDLIDFDYRYADTVEDTPDKLDPAILDAVGEAVAQLTINLSDQ